MDGYDRSPFVLVTYNPSTKQEIKTRSHDLSEIRRERQRALAAGNKIINDPSA